MRRMKLLGAWMLSGFVVFSVPTVALAHDGEEHNENPGHEALHDRLENQHDKAHERLREQHAALHERLKNSNLSPEQKRRIHNAQHDKLQDLHDSVHQKLRRQHAGAHANPPNRPTPTPTVSRPASLPTQAVRPAPAVRTAPAPIRRAPAAAPVQARRR